VYRPSQGPFPFAVTPAFYVTDAYSFESVVVADIDGDGYADVIIPATSLTAHIAVAHGHSDGTLDLPVPVNVQGGVVNGGVLAAGDMNGDGSADLLVTDVSLPSTFVVLLNDGHGNFTRASSIAATGISAQLADLNGDGLPEIVFVTEDQSSAIFYIAVCQNDGAGTLEPPRRLAALAENFSFGIGDFDGDGAPDIAFNGVSTTLLGETHVLMNHWPSFTEQAPAGGADGPAVEQRLRGRGKAAAVNVKSVVSCTGFDK
jgi:hypothetical protein